MGGSVSKLRTTQECIYIMPAKTVTYQEIKSCYIFIAINQIIKLPSHTVS